MVFVEKIKKGEKEYYYISKNFRINSNSWRRIKKYAGKKNPEKKDIQRIAKKIEEQALKEGLIKKLTKYKYLTNSQAEILEDLKETYKNWKKKLSKTNKEKYDNDFLIRFTYNTNAIEGNTLTLRETNMIIQEKIIPSDVNEKEYLEVINGEKTMDYVKKYEGELNTKFILKTHKILTKRILKNSGNYRTTQTIILGSEHKPPKPEKINELMKKLIIKYNNKKRTHHPIEMASIIHNEFVRIHPFEDGNGRTGRIIMNFLLKKNEYPLFLIENNERNKYYKAIEKSDKGEEKIFIKLILNNLIKQHRNKK